MGETEHLAWLVPRRSDVQGLLLRIYDAAKKHEPNTDDNRTIVLQFLLGTAFSLWRAVFLLDRPRDRASMHKDALAFLEFLIEDNIVLYAQDKKTGAWSGGHYLQNA